MQPKERERIVREMQKELIGPRYCGVTFSGVRGSKENIKALHGWLQNPHDFCLVTGSPGVGKTYICSALIDWMFGKVRSLRYWNERDIFERLRSMIGSDRGGDYIKEISYILDDQFLIIDDMGSAGFNDWRREIWLEIIDARYNSQLPTFITSNLTYAEIKKQMGVRSHSRLMSKENTLITMHDQEDLRQNDG